MRLGPRMTPEEAKAKVLARWPDAKCEPDLVDYRRFVIATPALLFDLSYGVGESEAWINAATNHWSMK